MKNASKKNWKLYCKIKCESGQFSGNLTLIFMIRCKYYKKKQRQKENTIIICGNTFLITALWADIFIAHIALNPMPISCCQSYPGDYRKLFFIAALMIWSFGQIVTLLLWNWLLVPLKYFFIDYQTWWYVLSWEIAPESFVKISSS